MRVTPESAEELVNLLMHHGVEGDGVIGTPPSAWSSAVRRTTGGSRLRERSKLRQLVNRIAAIEQDALVAIDEGDVASQDAVEVKLGIVGEKVGVPIKRVEYRPHRALRSPYRPVDQCAYSYRRASPIHSPGRRLAFLFISELRGLWGGTSRYCDHCASVGCFVCKLSLLDAVNVSRAQRACTELMQIWNAALIANARQGFFAPQAPQARRRSG